MLAQHVTSHLVIAGQRVLISYDGKPTTCYGCGETGHLYPTCPRRQRRAPLPSPTSPVKYATVAATRSQSSGDQLGNDIQGDSPHLLERVVVSNDHSVDSSPHDPERCTSPMDSNPDAELGDPHTSNLAAPEHTTERSVPRCQRSPPPPPGKRTTPGKGEAAKSRQTPRHPLSSSETSIKDDDTVDAVEASTS